MTSGSGMSGTPSPGSATPAPGRRAPSLGRTRRGNCHGGTRSVGASGGEKWEVRGGSHRLSILWQTWSPGIIGIRTTREQISWGILQLKIDSFYIGEEFCLVDHSIDQIVSLHYTLLSTQVHWTKKIFRLNTMRGGGRPNQERKSIVKKTESDSRLDGEKYWINKTQYFRLRLSDDACSEFWDRTLKIWAQMMKIESSRQVWSERTDKD